MLVKIQVQIPPELIETILKDAECEIYQKSDKQIVAVKRMMYSRIQFRFKRHIWQCNIHFEKGLRLNRLFNSKELEDVVEKHIKTFVEKY